MKNSCIAVLVLLSLLSSCSRKQEKKQEKEKELAVPALTIRDSVYLSNLKTVIASSSCFEIHKKERRVFSLIYRSSLEYKNLLYVSLSRYYFGGFENKDVDKEEIDKVYGAFYSRIEEKSYLFIVEKSEYLPSLLFEKTDQTMDMSSYVGLELSSDADWYLNDENGNFELLYILCQ